MRDTTLRRKPVRAEIGTNSTKATISDKGFNEAPETATDTHLGEFEEERGKVDSVEGFSNIQEGNGERRTIRTSGEEGGSKVVREEGKVVQCASGIAEPQLKARKERFKQSD